MLTGDWAEFGTKEELLRKFPEVFPGNKFLVGWIEHSDTDTALVVPEMIGDQEIYRLTVWNRQGIRSQLSSLLGLAVFK